MSGGTYDELRQRCARRLSIYLLSGLMAAPAALAATRLAADESARPARSDAAATTSSAARSAARALHRKEKSIIVDEGAAEPEVALATDESSAPADGPIAIISEYDTVVVDDAPAGPAPLEQPVVQPDAAGGVVASDDESSVPQITLEAAAFNGIVPGVTTRRELIKQWGKPAAQDRGDDTLTYEFKSFPTVAISFDDDCVESIGVELREPVSAARLITKLGLVGVRPATVANASGDTVSTIFPERGVSLNHRPGAAAAVASDDGAPAIVPQGDDAVYEIELHAIGAEPFLLRAAGATAGERTQQIADLETALRLDPESAAARAMLAGLKLAGGQALEAEKLAAEAVQLEPRNDDYRLAWSRCLRRLARYEDAVREARTVLEDAHVEPLVRAQALEQMGLLAALGPQEVRERAIPLHTEAIALADELSASNDPAVSIPAMQLLVEAHLAVAERVASAQWKNKDVSVANWISRASGLAEQMIANGDADVSLRLQVAVSALAAGGKLDPPIDPALWIAEAEQTVNRLHAESKDGAGATEIDWQLGVAYCYAMEIQHRRGEAENALKYGALAEAALAPLAAGRAQFPDTDYVLGRMYFQIGAVHAVHGQDHAMACRWYDRACDALSRPAPVTEMASPKPHSDALVSMGVSYWNIGKKELAYELTKAGVALAEQGVDANLISASDLTVAQHNLEAMTRAINAENAPGDFSATQVAEAEPTARKPSSARTSSQPRARTANRSTSGETRRR
jgi:tetratricopeptide (TPR) repeat protein